MQKIAVVVPVYNCGNTILKTFKSLEKQSFKDWIAIVVDDGSNDNSIQILKSINQEKIEIIILGRNFGRGYARQKALEKIRELGFQYMCMLDADDWYYPEKLEIQYNFMENNPKVTLLSSAMSLSNKENIIYNVIKPYNEIKYFYFDDYLSFTQLPHASSIIRVKDIDGVNYDENFTYSEDLDFLRRILFKRHYAYLPVVSYCYNRDDSFSFNKYLHSTKFNIKSFNKLSIKNIHKLKYLFKSVFKIAVVFILSIFGLENIYLRNIGQKPNQDDIFNYEELKKIL